MASQLQEMDYFDAVINETLRMSMSVTNAVPRIAAQDSYIDGVFIPKGTTIAINLYEAHHNPRVWNNPYSFKPERFEPGGEYEKLKAQGDGTAFIAFGIGPRLCVGQNLAIAEMRVFLAMLRKLNILSSIVFSLTSYKFADMNGHCLRILFTRMPLLYKVWHFVHL